MSILRKGDEKIHYSDNSHRWIAPTEEEQESWTEMVRAHLSDHRGWRDTPGPPSRRRLNGDR